MERPKGLLERLKSGDTIISAEGYIIELGRRGYNDYNIPRAVLENPHKVEELTREFVHAGAEVCSAFTYFGTKNKLATAGEGDNFTLLNRRALEIAKKVARETETLFTVGLAKTGLYDPDDPQSHVRCEEEYREQMALCVEYEVDFIQIQTLWDYGEASIALKVAKDYNLPAIVTMAPSGPGTVPKTFDGYELSDALQRLLDEGAACVGVNCSRGPRTIIPIMKKLRQDIKGPLACLAVPYRTTAEQNTWYRLRDVETGKPLFYDDLCTVHIGNAEAKWYAEQLKEIGVQFVGFCCGNSAAYTRTLAMTYGRNPPAARYASEYQEQKETVQGFQLERYGEQLAQFLGSAKK